MTTCITACWTFSLIEGVDVDIPWLQFLSLKREIYSVCLPSRARAPLATDVTDLATTRHRENSVYVLVEQDGCPCEWRSEGWWVRLCVLLFLQTWGSSGTANVNRGVAAWTEKLFHRCLLPTRARAESEKPSRSGECQRRRRRRVQHTSFACTSTDTRGGSLWSSDWAPRNPTVALASLSPNWERACLDVGKLPDDLTASETLSKLRILRVGYHDDEFGPRVLFQPGHAAFPRDGHHQLCVLSLPVSWLSHGATLCFVIRKRVPSSARSWDLLGPSVCLARCAVQRTLLHEACRAGAVTLDKYAEAAVGIFFLRKQAAEAHL